ncbi:MAG TPA: hypothetical protein VMM78_14420 [Thermomicrobiales bacterium]|nr:hypothetical protein [Thermomicrobiales bacterium]
MSGQTGQRESTCQACGNVAPAGALYCPSCGARLTPTPGAPVQTFEDAIASVLGDESEPAWAERAASASDSSEVPTTFEPVSAVPSPGQRPTQGWATTAPPEAGGWPAFPPEQANKGRNRTLWIVLSVFGFIVFCCCGVTFVSVAVASA